MDLRKELPGVEIWENEPMAKHTTFKIGGPARWICLPQNGEQAAAVLAFCHKNGIKPFFLGNGSNLLVSDAGYDGVMVSTARMERMALEGENTLYADSGVLLSRLANFAADHALTGLEWAAGIPGSLGGAVRMNAGAYGGEMADVLERVEVLSEEGHPGALEPAGCALSYRHSVFCAKPWLITGAHIALRPGDPEEIRKTMAELAARRREKQPLEYPSAGSTFKRPEGHFAAALIDQCGLKGARRGDAQVSEKHGGFVINRGNATCRDVLELMAFVQEQVREQTGVILEPEVEILG